MPEEAHGGASPGGEGDDGMNTKLGHFFALPVVIEMKPAPDPAQPPALVDLRLMPSS